MSFKRDGDDKSALDNQRKRRVADLLYEDIDEEEVTRLSNGKFKCKLCSHQPIFDTLNMFYVHKQGKKHQYSMEYATQQKQELEDLIKKRKHEQLARSGHTVTNQSQEETGTTEDIKNTVLGMKKPRRPYDRKPVIDFDIFPCNKAASPVTIETTTSNQLPGNRFSSFCTTKNPESFSGHVRMGGNSDRDKFAGGKLNTRSFVTVESKHDFKMQYINRSASRNCSENSVVNARNVHKLVGQSNAEHNNKYYLSRKKEREETSSVLRNTDGGISDKTINQPTVLPTQTWEFYKDFKGKLPFRMKSVEKPLHKCSTDTKEEEKVQGHDSIRIESVKLENTAGGSCTEKREKAEKYLKALGSGWKKDWTGSWIKDDDAEFDSDEEPPDIP
ncbi:uncharacterized protein LOC123537174 [Mercenaria mercenaria]|uniref:uncharacterized protein LOC123537174 n=1 Tax=Mercenaria mercenaria TaxID=6596 RepID=UPI00234FA910|nr:uncharacterized protein LOC123537174 [Mercenaria mercenaria]XP_045176720.2 uncharacterized protein LOC123537174 [Mercenaria mercenaria]